MERDLPQREDESQKLIVARFRTRQLQDVSGRIEGGGLDITGALHPDQIGEHLNMEEKEALRVYYGVVAIRELDRIHTGFDEVNMAYILQIGPDVVDVEAEILLKQFNEINNPKNQA